MNTFLINGSAIFLILFAVLSFADGVFLHLIKYRLQEKGDSRREHLAHMGRSILFIPIALMLFYWNLSGTWLWILAALVVVDLAIEFFDVLEERRSRQKIGGLSSGEYLLHVSITTVRVAAITLAFASKPKEAWLSDVTLPQYSEPVRFVSAQLIPGAILIALIHIVLVFRPMLVSEVVGKLKKLKVL